MNITRLLSVALLAIATTGILSSCHTSRKGMKKLYKEVRKDQTNAHVSWKGDSIRVVYPEVAMFDFGKDQIKQDAYPAFKRYADIMNRYTWVSFVINGYTDNVGTDDVNKSLSERRAMSAKDLLQSDGISTSRMSTNGFGSGNPIMDNATEAGRQANRRVEFLLYKRP
jgi:outer membrane protein OmpA-like peptidoglycan-associated protein